MSNIRTRVISFEAKHCVSLIRAALLAEIGRSHKRGTDTCTEPHITQLGLLQSASLCNVTSAQNRWFECCNVLTAIAH